jgi:hypothetical protein
MIKFAISHFDDRAALEGLKRIILKCSFYENSTKNEDFSLTLLNAVISQMKEIKNLEIIAEFNTQNLENTPGHAILNFLVRVYRNQKIDQKFFLVNISSALTQNVLLERNKMCLVSWANTWNYTDVVLLEDIKTETLKTALLEQANQFKISFEKANT